MRYKINGNPDVGANGGVGVAIGRHGPSGLAGPMPNFLLVHAWL